MANIGTIEGVLRLRDDFSATMGRFRTQLEPTVKGVSALGQALGTLGVVAAGLAIGRLATELTQLGTAAIKAADQQARADALLAAAVKSTGLAAGLTTSQLKGMASALQDTTNIADDVIQGAQAIGLQFNRIGGETFPRFITAAVDLSAKLGRELNPTVLQLGRALQEPDKALKQLTRQGVTFTAAEEKLVESFMDLNQVAKAQAVVLGAVERASEGTAEALADNLLGDVQKVKIQWGELLEKLGATADVFRPIVQELVKGLKFLNENFGLLSAGVQAAMSVFVFSVTQGASGAVTALREVVTGIQVLLKVLEEMLHRTGGTAVLDLLGLGDLAKGGLGAMRAGFAGAAAALDQLNNKVQTVGVGLAKDLGVAARDAFEAWRTGADGAEDATLGAGEAIKGTTLSLEELMKKWRELDELAKKARAAMPQAPMGELVEEAKGILGGGDVNRSWWERMVDGLKQLPGGLQKVKIETREIADETKTLAEKWNDVASVMAVAFGQMESGSAQAIAQFAAMTMQVIQLVAQLKAAGEGSYAMAAGIAGIAGAAFSAFGGATGDRGKGRFGGQLSGDHSDTGAAAGAVIGGIVGTFALPGLGTAAGAMIGQTIGMIVGSFIKRGADEGLAEIRKVGDQILTTVTKNEGGLGDILGDIGEGIANWFENLEDQLGTKIVDFPFFSLKLRDDMIVVFIDNIRAEFETIEEAMEFAIVSALKHVKFAGGLSENVAAVLEAHVFETLEELEHAVNVALTVDRLGIPDFQLELRDEFEALQKLADEIERLGGSAENVWKRLGELTQSRRDMILGITETEEEKLRREVEAFNAERLRVLDQYNVERAAVEKQLAELQIIAAQGAGFVSQEMISALVAKLAQLDAAIAGVAAEITESDIAGVLKPPKKGGGGRREAREGFEGGLLDTIAQGMGVVDQMLDDYSAQVTKIQEETKKLKGDTDLAAKAIEVLGKVLREDLIQTAADIGSSFGISTFATKLAARQLRMDLDAMAQAMLAAGATMEEVMQALGEANLNIFLNIADQMAQAIGDETLLAELAQMRHQMELHNYRLQIEMLRDLGIISETQHATLLNLVDRWNKAFEASNLVGIPIGGGGDAGTGGGGDVDMGGGFFRRPDGSIYFAGGGPGQPGNPFGGGPAANDNSAMERALSILEAWEDLGGSSFGQELERLNEEFEILLDTFGRSPRVLAAAGLALNDLLERALAPVTEFQEGLLFSEFSPLTLEQQFAEAQARFNELVALGDPADAAEIASMAQLLLGLGEQVLSIGGAGFQDLFFDVNSALTDFSQNAIVNAANQLDVSVDQLEVMRRSEAHQERMAGALERLEQNSGLFQNVVNL